MTSPPYWKLRLNGTKPQDWGDWTGELGNEPSREMYISHLADVFDEIKRVLRTDGTCWVNISDKRNTKIKDMNCIPEMFILEMRNRGWILRNKIVWNKRNIMPSSARDRLADSYEMVYLFVKSKKYWFDGFSIREGRRGKTHGRGSKLSPPSESAGIGHKGWAKATAGVDTFDGKRNARDLWTLTNEPLPEEHYAAYPQKLCERPIKAGCPTQICSQCGNPRERIMQHMFQIMREKPTKIQPKQMNNPDVFHFKHGSANKNIKTTGWTKCKCNKKFIPGTVLDPFCGSGTTLLVARRLGRKSIGIDLKYQDIALRRLNVDQQRINL